MEDMSSFSMNREEDDFRMIQEHYIYFALYFYYSYLSSTLDHQALGPEGLGTPGLEGMRQ